MHRLSNDSKPKMKNTKIAKKANLQKKAVFFTVAAIAVASAFILISSKSQYTQHSTDSLFFRAQSMELAAKSISGQVESGIRSASYWSFVSMGEYILENNVFLSNVNSSFNESFFNGTIGGQELFSMNNKTFNEWSEKLLLEAKKIGAETELEITHLSINQTDPWSIEISANYSLLVLDKEGTLGWRTKNKILSKISINGIPDPLYYYHLSGTVNNTFQKTNITNFVVSKNTSALLFHLNNSLYANNSLAPSFLMRFEGDFGSSKNGIESLVNLKELQDAGEPIFDRSAVDYIYFENLATTNYRINNTPSWFKLDSNHLAAYNSQDITCNPAECITT